MHNCDAMYMLFIAVPFSPVVRINPFNRVALAGESLRVTCSVIPQEGILEGNLAVTWSRDGGVPLPSGESFGPMIFISSVRTSHGGEYICTARLNIPEAKVDISGTNTTSISIECSYITVTLSMY